MLTMILTQLSFELAAEKSSIPSPHSQALTAPQLLRLHAILTRAPSLHTILPSFVSMQIPVRAARLTATEEVHVLALSLSLQPFLPALFCLGSVLDLLLLALPVRP
jgi:hypothetical protein